MIDCLNVARYFIVRAYEDGIEAEMTNMKVQKLLYYSQSLHLVLYDRPLFDEEIQAWRYGPVCPPAYKFYSEFEANQLPIPNKEESLRSLPDGIKELLEEVWEYFGGYHAYRLSNMTHEEFPWKKARKGLPPQASSTEPIQLQQDLRKETGFLRKIIGLVNRYLPKNPVSGFGCVSPVQDMQALGKQKLDSIERENPAYEPVISKALNDALNSESSTRIRKGEVHDWLNSLLD
jgi:uncharacterized phage-associated protein